jgi:glycosyltransferase involved in cell wall biosynthesis
VGGTPELIIDGISGRLIDFGDHRQLVDSITTLLGCDTQRQTFQANAVKSISEKFSYESMITKTETILMNAVNSGARTK